MKYRFILGFSYFILEVQIKKLKGYVNIQNYINYYSNIYNNKKFNMIQIFIKLWMEKMGESFRLEC